MQDLQTIQRLHQSGQLQEAEAAYLDYLEQSPYDATAWHYLGLLYAEMGNLVAAERVLVKAKTLFPTYYPPVVLHLANVYKAKGDYELAIEQLTDLINHDDSIAEAYNNLGTIWHLQKKYAAAIENFQAALLLNASYIDAYYNLGLSYTKILHHREAKNVYESLLTIMPDHIGGHFQLGCLLMQEQHYQLAASHFEYIHRRHPDHFETITNLATCTLKLGNMKQALQFYTVANRVHAEDTQVLYNLGVINMQLGHVKEAIDYYLASLAVNNNDYAVHNNLGIAYLAVKQQAKAIQYFYEALRLQPENRALQFTLASLTQNNALTQPPADYVRALFDSYADHYDFHLQQTLHYHAPDYLYDMTSRHLPSGQKWQIADIGCGTGLSGEKFKAIATRLIGIDLSTQMLQAAKQKSIYDECIEDDAVHYLATKQQEFDLVIASDVLVYFGELDSLLGAIHQALKSSGYVVFTTEITEGKDYLLLPTGRFAHARSYIDRVLQEKGFEIVDYTVKPLRMHDDIEVMGHVYLARKQ